MMPMERMTARARAYMAIAAARHLLIAGFCLFAQDTFASPSYQGLRDAVPFVSDSAAIPFWGFAFLITGSACAFGGIRGSEGVARWALLMSVITTAAVGGGFLAAWFQGSLAGPTGPVIWFAIAFKDLTMLGNPLRNPFEPVVKRVLADAPQPD